MFAEQGFDASLRTIARAALVSAPLILHYFGSREGLRAACDERFRSRIFAIKSSFLDPMRGPGQVRRLQDTVTGYAPLLGYLLRVLSSGGPEARRFIDVMVSDTEQFLAQGVDTGVVRPSVDGPGRARILVEMAFGIILFELAGDGGPLDLDALPTRVSEYWRRVSLPLLELATHGYLADPHMLEAAADSHDHDHEPDHHHDRHPIQNQKETP